MAVMSIVALWNQVQTTAKSGTSGYQSQDEFNNDLATVQLRIANVLCDNYDISQKVEDALFGMMVTQTADTTSTGVVETPASYFRLISLWLNTAGKKYPTNKLQSNEIATYETSYVRKPVLATNNVAYYYLDNKIQMMPEAQMNVTLVYCKTPPPASITLTQVNSDESDYVTPTVGVELAWSNVLFNLFVYMMLEMLGIEQKENILYEYSQLGIPKEAYLGVSLTT